MEAPWKTSVQQLSFCHVVLTTIKLRLLNHKILTKLLAFGLICECTCWEILLYASLVLLPLTSSCLKMGYWATWTQRLSQQDHSYNIQDIQDKKSLDC